MSWTRGIAIKAKDYMKLKENHIFEAVTELSSTKWWLVYAFAEKYHQETIPEPHEDFTFLGLSDTSVSYQDRLTLYSSLRDNDWFLILTQGIKKCESGGKIYAKHREFLEYWKKVHGTEPDPEIPDDIAVGSSGLITEIYKACKDPEIKALIKQHSGSFDHTLSELALEDHLPKVFHYVSARFPGEVLVQPVSTLKEENLLLGYATCNCLGVFNLYEHSSHPNAKSDILWMNGQIVGMGYDIRVRNPMHGIDPHIDSIELGEQFYKGIRSFETEGGEVGDREMAQRLVWTYLSHKLQQSENGIYIAIESNDLHVESAIESFAEMASAKQIMSIAPGNLEMDAKIERLPFWIHRENYDLIRERMIKRTKDRTIRCTAEPVLGRGYTMTERKKKQG